MPGVLPVHSHMYDGACMMAFKVGNAQFLHQLGVACSYIHAVHLARHAMAADLLHIRDPLPVDMFTVGFLQALADGMCGTAFDMGGIFQQFIIA